MRAFGTTFHSRNKMTMASWMAVTAGWASSAELILDVYFGAASSSVRC
jgi:hypothetical protein